MNAEQIRHARAMPADPEATVTSLAKQLDVSRTTLSTCVPELKARGPRHRPTG
ncbi:hypothetical protein [Streptomyces sp. NPDC058701]|uniref:hypothetical protein n=1 Tax=Streptomyces sp. NPDC058701 TaxID=3346608 RepID=UPI00365413B7